MDDIFNKLKEYFNRIEKQANISDYTATENEVLAYDPNYIDALFRKLEKMDKEIFINYINKLSMIENTRYRNCLKKDCFYNTINYCDNGEIISNGGKLECGFKSEFLLEVYYGKNN